MTGPSPVDAVVSNGAPLDARKRAGPPVDKGVDFANYFCTYAFLYHQKEMLSDRVRMKAYHDAIFLNPKHFKGKTVLDVGTGSGILAIWAAQAGARKVYAVEATNMAAHAEKLVASNRLADRVQVIQGSIEDVELPEKVDVIISEWMGYFLVRESMLDSVIAARDNWLKPDGVMYPSHARMWLAPISTETGERKLQEYEQSMADWAAFRRDTWEDFHVDMSALTDSYRAEQEKYFLQTSVWSSLYPGQVAGRPAVIKELDCRAVSVADLEAIRADFRLPLHEGTVRLTGFGGWFDVHFKGSRESPAEQVVELSTAPSRDETTHWGQQLFLLHPSLRAEAGDVVEGSMQITRAKHNHRLMDVTIQHALTGRRGGPPPLKVVSNFFIE